jgi:hypothetical protein
MKLIALVSLMLASGATFIGAADENASQTRSWSMDRTTGAWTHRPTGISVPKSIDGFKRKSAEPFNKDGTAIFSYSSDKAVITLYLGHRSLEGFPGNEDCTPALRDNYIKEMHRRHGKTDSETPFRLQFARGGKRASGVGSICHFVSDPEFSGDPAYSEIGAVLIGDYLYYYRATLFEKAGRGDLAAFLEAIGIKKI